MNKLRRKLNQFHKIYDLTFRSTHMERADMYNHNKLMSMYECIWETLEYEAWYDNADIIWLRALYGELGDYICKDKCTMSVFSKIIAQIFHRFNQEVQ